MAKEQMQALYRDAADKRQQLEILADLNDTTPYRIADVLHVDYKPKTWKVEWSDETVSNMRNMLKQGYSVCKIAKTIGINVATVSKKINALNLRKEKKNG